jgi:hypothetical protein
MVALSAHLPIYYHVVRCTGGNKADLWHEVLYFLVLCVALSLILG